MWKFGDVVPPLAGENALVRGYFTKSILPLRLEHLHISGLNFDIIKTQFYFLIFSLKHFLPQEAGPYLHIFTVALLAS